MYIQISVSTCTERGNSTYKTLEVLGPEHEFSVVDNGLRPLPIVDKILKDFRGRVVNFIEQPTFSFGKELQLHVMEVKPNEPFRSPKNFDETMQAAVLFLLDFLDRKYKAKLLGTGMHPLLRLDDTGIWPHRHRQIYKAYSAIFNLKRQGWLNIQSYQLNLPYSNEQNGILLHNLIAPICAYLPAVAASSPVYNGRLGDSVDNRLCFYMVNQKEVPSVTGDVVPEYVSSFREYQEAIIEKYSSDMAKAGADRIILCKDWVNSRGAIFRFDRRAVEIRVMDEQECVKSDVALSCFIRALLRGLIRESSELPPHEVLVKDFGSVVKDGLRATTVSSDCPTARQMCKRLLRIAEENATGEEKEYLSIVRKRIESGNLSEIIRDRIERKTQKTSLREAIVNVYSKLAESLMDNQPYF